MAPLCVIDCVPRGPSLTLRVTWPLQCTGLLHYSNQDCLALPDHTTDRRHSYHHKRLMSKNSNRNVTAVLVVAWSGLVGDPRSGGGRGDLMLLLLLRGFLHDCVCRAVCLTNNPGQYFIFRSSRVPIYLGRCIDKLYYTAPHSSNIIIQVSQSSQRLQPCSAGHRGASNCGLFLQESWLPCGEIFMLYLRQNL